MTGNTTNPSLSKPRSVAAGSDASTHRMGMQMTTSLSSRASSWSSYSMLTSQPVALSEGQQFTGGEEEPGRGYNRGKHEAREAPHD